MLSSCKSMYNTYGCNFFMTSCGCYLGNEERKQNDAISQSLYKSVYGAYIIAREKQMYIFYAKKNVFLKKRYNMRETWHIGYTYIYNES